MMEKLYMAVMVSVMVAGISVISSTMVHAGPTHYTQAEIAEWHEIQATTARELKAQHEAEQRNLNPHL